MKRIFNHKVKIKCILIFCIVGFLACQKETKKKEDKESFLLNKPYDSVCFLMTHNAMNNSEKGYTIPNQTHSITHQLENGVRGLMIDTYDGMDGHAMTYHAVALTGSQKLVDVLKEVKDYLVAKPKEVITIIFENQGSNGQLKKAIDSLALDKMAFVKSGSSWPTLQTMVDSNQRLVMFSEFVKSPTISYMSYAWGTIFDTKYTYKNVSEFDSDINRGGSGSKDLYLVNHWLQNFIGLPDKSLAPQANNRAVLGKRVQDCANTNHHFINFLGVDFYEIGEAKAVADSINAAK
ncbi:MAG TPA: phosphatidylinositol-specific phospholipase C domain-containing protein [Chitinophagales bacterium]|jgi:hypothetical protein|nr:phosphatidylinositol-specific phospholipase C domain-containing protein [Chitinophagales bacterium]HQV78815.1 phosphatidylinositol-specific phospholipase C domain-containing protein [Chitinophagales bacterium]HQW79181.1 phosphatidylinositol-specific phospholipase C domain-containing protein [Chitinophagales bacterium]HRB18517.1 phosphatidylinositol-specific phospholipase C domain-containing protein [Chitinophagales bacterium]HRB67970.1 phosphatidylinositol-specific phospholipase C domain-con